MATTCLYLFIKSNTMMCAVTRLSFSVSVFLSTLLFLYVFRFFWEHQTVDLIYMYQGIVIVGWVAQPVLFPHFIDHFRAVKLKSIDSSHTKLLCFNYKLVPLICLNQCSAQRYQHQPSLLLQLVVFSSKLSNITIPTHKKTCRCNFSYLNMYSLHGHWIWWSLYFSDCTTGSSLTQRILP